jgi:hypothetical protein
MDEQAHSGSSGEEASRPPEQSDLVLVCRELNRLGAKYIVVGGLAVIEAGFPRLTNDIDLLIEVSPSNESLVFEALRILPDRAVEQLIAGDVERHVVVRVADVVVVDLMARACGIDYATASQDTVSRKIDGVEIPFAAPRMLLRMKQTHRDKDIQDRAFLTALIHSAEKGEDDAGVIESIRRFLKNQ